MKVIKYCKEQHNLLRNCTTVRLGTLEDFRKNYKGEDDFINDDKEGIGSRLDSRNNLVYNSPIIPNCYIFCVTFLSVDQNIEKDFDPDYNSYYVIDNVNIFSEILTLLLEQQLSISDFQNPRVVEDFSVADFRALKIATMRGKINYVDNRPFIDDPLRGVFYKPEKYVVQNEFRFAFVPVHPKIGYIPVKREAKLLDTRMVNKYLSTNIPPQLNQNITNNFINTIDPRS